MRAHTYVHVHGNRSVGFAGPSGSTSLENTTNSLKEFSKKIELFPEENNVICRPQNKCLV
jgi:hypothetical protein